MQPFVDLWICAPILLLLYRKGPHELLIVEYLSLHTPGSVPPPFSALTHPDYQPPSKK